MAYNDTLFQLGMDLTRSSPAQEEDTFDQVHALHGDRSTRSDSRYSSVLLVDLAGIKPQVSAKQVERALEQALAFMKVDVRSIAIGRADASGVLSGMAVLADGHVIVSAVPGKARMSIDMTSRSGVRPDVAMTGFADAFGAREVTLKKSRSEAERARLQPTVIAMASSARAVQPAAKRRVVAGDTKSRAKAA